jgi:hypothetical protein
VLKTDSGAVNVKNYRVYRLVFKRTFGLAYSNLTRLALKKL